MVALSLLDLVTNVWPLQAGLLEWRYGAWGLLSGYLLTPLLGMIMLAAAAALMGHARALAALFWVNLLVAAVLLVGSVFFVLDVVQLRGAVPVGEQSRYDTGASKALLKHVLVAAALFWLGRACRTAAKQSRAPRIQGKPDVLVTSPPR
jgi:hypothetical protein